MTGSYCNVIFTGDKCALATAPFPIPVLVAVETLLGFSPSARVTHDQLEGLGFWNPFSTLVPGLLLDLTHPPRIKGLPCSYPFPFPSIFSLISSLSITFMLVFSIRSF